MYLTTVLLSSWVKVSSQPYSQSKFRLSMLNLRPNPALKQDGATARRLSSTLN